MSEDPLHIDKRTHERVPSLGERIIHALLSAFLGFLLLNIIIFWMFPGAGIGALYMFAGYHKVGTIASEMTTVLIYTVLALCFVFGWFRGKSFIHRLKDYIKYWRFW
ncbi:hypothetical protein CK503_01650 [Aliifodinibius salipaludis]|uniref:Uncharacterized protein n=1 Tax=Fodinibius salipaludis TaxID=2032627 RepID=A0A2A2GE42_9BACT|nr:hypothetical protein CK503_01650 [Aliifodinibius salipaludis]